VGIPDYGGAILNMNEDGTFSIRIGTVDFGQGIATSYAQIVAEAMNIPIEKVKLFVGTLFDCRFRANKRITCGVYVRW